MTIIRARSEHAKPLLANLRENSITDIELTSGDLVGALETELENSLLAYAGFVDGEIAAIWGVKSSSMVSGYGYLWMVTTAVADDNPFLFARYSRRILDVLMRDFVVLHGFVDRKYERSIRWLRWLGFEIMEPERHGKLLLRPFVRRK